MIPLSIFLLISQSNKLAVAANVFVYSRIHLISMAVCLYTVLMLMVNSSSKMNSVRGLCPPRHCHPSVGTCYSQHPKTSYFEKWVSFEPLVFTFHSLSVSKDWSFWKEKMGLIRNCILISLFSVHLPFAVSIGHSVHRLVILKMSLIGTFFVVSLYPFTWILPNILRWVFFMHSTNYPSFSFPILVSCIIFAFKHLPRYACSL